MANKNLSQLPENTDPQDTDWLLLASGDSPTVFQKAAVGNLPGSASAGGSIKFALPINENYVLTSSGYYFTDAIASDIEIDCSNLEIGDHIYWVNESTKSVFFSGLNSIDYAYFPSNKTIKIKSGNLLEFFLKDESKNTKKLLGNYDISWNLGYLPPFQTFSFSSYSNYDDIFNAIGNLNNQTYINPLISGRIGGTSSQIATGYNLEKAFDHQTSESRWNNASNAENWIIIDFKNYEAKINKIVIYGTAWVTAGLNNRIIYFYGSHNGEEWNLITSWTQSAGVSQSISPNFDGLNFYRYFKWYVPSSGWIQIEEFKWYGDLIGLI
jgi:hypothetical protein